MPRRMEIIATAIDTIDFVPTHLQRARGIARTIVRRNDVIVPELPIGWMDRVLPLFPRALDSVEINWLESILNIYILDRMARLYPITWKNLRSRLQRISELSKALLDELNNQSPAYLVAWSKISSCAQHDGGQDLTHDDVYPIVSRLHGSAHRALVTAIAEREAGQKGHHGEPWACLVASLRTVYERTGGHATAAKNLRDGQSAKPSDFVALVSAVMQTMPNELREHQQSPGAMASAVSRVLSK